jgi:hypothetical protein
MACCPFLGVSPENKAPWNCLEDKCALYLSQENGWKWGDKPWSGCSFLMQMHEIDKMGASLASLRGCIVNGENFQNGILTYHGNLGV